MGTGKRVLGLATQANHRLENVSPSQPMVFVFLNDALHWLFRTAVLGVVLIKERSFNSNLCFPRGLLPRNLATEGYCQMELFDAGSSPNNGHYFRL